VILNNDDAVYAANIFIDFFSDLNRVDEYLRNVKIERMSEYGSSLPGMGPEDEMFQDFSISPENMNFKVYEVKSKEFITKLQIVSSHTVEASIPGKELLLCVKETNSDSIVGFIRLGSPTINSKPRNEFLGQPLRTTDKKVMKRFNDSAIMGFIIVPTQPFGFNYLGGKLLAGICCSHEVRDKLNKKYGGPFCLFETTSLYGSTKAASQYDGMKPFLRYKGLTDSKFTPLLNDNHFRNLSDWFIEKNNGEHLVPVKSSSKKLKTQTKMISIIKKSLKNNKEVLDKFNQACYNGLSITEKKRTFFCDYGYENVKDYLNLETDELKKKDNYDRYSMENIVEWWRKKASKRFESLKKDGRLRTELEVWNKNNDIDIIR
jgi:hypothetical protein